MLLWSDGTDRENVARGSLCIIEKLGVASTLG